MDKIENAFENLDLKDVPKINNGKITEILADISHRLQSFTDRQTSLFEKLDRSIQTEINPRKESARQKAVHILKTIIALPAFRDVSTDQIANTSYLFSNSESKVERSENHRDSHYGEWFCIFCMSNDVPPLEFCNPSRLNIPKSFNFEEYMLGNSCSPGDREKVCLTEHFQAFQNLLLPSCWIEEAFRPVLDKNWTVGNMVLVRGDVIHRSPEYLGYRNVGFFTVAPPGAINRYQASEQYTATTVLVEILKGSVTLKVSDEIQTILAEKLRETMAAIKNQQPWNRFFSNEKLSGALKNLALSTTPKDVKKLISNLVRVLDVT